MRFNNTTSHDAATELSDQALLGVFGGCDAATHAGPATTMASSSAVSAPSVQVPVIQSGSLQPGGDADHGSAVPPPTTVSGGPVTPGALPPSAALTPAHAGVPVPSGPAVSTGDVGAAHPGIPGAAKPQLKDQDDACDRFDQGAHDAHDGFHQIVDGAAAIAHAVIDTMPHVHGPIGQLIHNRFHKNDR